MPSEKPVRLEPLAMSHLAGVMTWVNDHEVMQYFANRQTDITEAEEKVFLEKLISSPNDRAFSIFEGDEYVGQCSVNQIYWPAKNGRLFIALKAEAQGRGIAQKALPLLFEKAWTELGMHKIYLIVRRDNRHSQALYLKLGMDFEGVLLDEYCVNGTYYDMVRMSIRAPSK
jgi:RimJ/RimL family protein N-acetyltransferase